MVFTYRDEVEGKIGIGKLPEDIKSLLLEIQHEYYNSIPDKNASTHHIWFNNMSENIQSKIKTIQQHVFWDKLCDNTDKCIKINANEMDELYYSNPKNLKNINLYGASSNYDIHRDCVFNFDGIKFYRVLIGLTGDNDNIVTYFNKFDVGHKINQGDYVVFDFDKTTHQVIKDKQKLTPRILLKLHYIVCENCKYSREYVDQIKNIYTYYEYVTRYIMQTGTDPETFYQFFFGLGCQFFYTKHIEYFVLIAVSCIIAFLHFFTKIKLVYKNIYAITKNVLSGLILIYLVIVLFYWARFKLLGIR